MPLKLEVFETEIRVAQPTTIVLDTGALEEERLNAFDKGYSAGWEDATDAQSDEQTRIRTDLTRHLQSLSFTYHEARAHILRSIEPLLLQVVGRLLPAVAREALAPTILEALLPLAEGLGDTPISLVINPASRQSVETLLQQTSGLPVTISEEPTLGECQAYLQVGGAETHVDLDRAISEIATAVRGFFEISEKERRYG